MVGTPRRRSARRPVTVTALDNPRHRRTQRVPAGLPAVTITAYVIRTRCLAAPAARGSRLDENRTGPPAHQGGPGPGRHVAAQHRQHQPQHLPLGARRGNPGRALQAAVLQRVRPPVQSVRHRVAAGHGRRWPGGPRRLRLRWDASRKGSVRDQARGADGRARRQRARRGRGAARHRRGHPGAVPRRCDSAGRPVPDRRDVRPVHRDAPGQEPDHRGARPTAVAARRRRALPAGGLACPR